MLNLFRKKNNPIANSNESSVSMIDYSGFPRFRDWFGGFDGSKYPGLYGYTKDYNSVYGLDYYTLRVRSRQQYVSNMYAKQCINRLTTNIINSGLTLQATPNKKILGLTDEEYTSWAKNTEDLYSMWSKDLSCDYHLLRTMGQLEQSAYLDALIEGDILVIIRMDEKTLLPKIELVPGRFVKNPLMSIDYDKNNKIIQGVEFNTSGQQIAYWVEVVDPEKLSLSKTIRVPRYGSKTGRLMAFLLYGQELEVGKVRGEPLLTPILEPLSQIGDYTSFELTAAKINALLVMFMKKNQDRPGSNPLSGIVEYSNLPSDPGVPISPPRANIPPGTIIHELQYGEEPVSFKTDRPNVNFPMFRDAILEAIASALEIPPEILALKFQNNFSASRQASIEFKTYINRARNSFSNQFNNNVYSVWLTSMVLSGRIKCPGYIEALNKNDIFIKNSWQSAKFIGIVKQNVDIFKEAQAYKLYIDEGLKTRSDAARELCGVDFYDNIDKLEDENEELAEARFPLLDQSNESGIDEALT